MRVINFEAAFASDDPLTALREALAVELSHGADDRDGLLVTLERAMLAMREAGREREEEVVTDATDFLTGWCSPRLAL